MAEKEYDFKSITDFTNPLEKEWKDMTEAEQIEKLKEELSEMESRLSRLTNRSGMRGWEKIILYVCLVASALSLPISLVCWALYFA